MLSTSTTGSAWKDQCISTTLLFYSLFTIGYSLFTIQEWLYTIHYSLYKIDYTLFTIQEWLFTIHYTRLTIHYSQFKLDYSLFTICDSWPPACPSIQASISAIWVEGLVNFGLLQPLPVFSFSSLWDLVGLSPVPLPKPLVVSFHSIWYCGFDLWTTGFIATFRAQWKLGSSHKTRNEFLDHSFILLMLDFAATANLSYESMDHKMSTVIGWPYHDHVTHCRHFLYIIRLAGPLPYACPSQWPALGTLAYSSARYKYLWVLQGIIFHAHLCYLPLSSSLAGWVFNTTLQMNTSYLFHRK